MHGKTGNYNILFGKYHSKAYLGDDGVDERTSY
jgi:hypothetical protein